MVNLKQGSESLKSDTLDFIFNYTKDAPEHQIHSAETLDAKVVQILSVSSIVIGLTVLTIGDISVNDVTIIPLISSVLAYMGVALLSISQIMTAHFRVSPHADILWPEYWDSDVKKIKHSLVSATSNAYRYNKSIIYKKNKLFLCALIAAVIEITSVAALVLLSICFP